MQLNTNGSVTYGIWVPDTHLIMEKYVSHSGLNCSLPAAWRNRFLAVSPTLPKPSVSLLSKTLPLIFPIRCLLSAGKERQTGVWKQEALFFPCRPSTSSCAVRYLQTRQPGLFLTPWEALGLLTARLSTENICRSTSSLRFACKLEQAPCGSGKRDRALCGENLSIQPCKLAPRSVIPLQECKGKALSCKLMQSQEGARH